MGLLGAGTIQDNVRDNQLKIIQIQSPDRQPTNLPQLPHHYPGVEGVGNQRRATDAGMLGALSPYRTHHINRFGMYELRERKPAPVDYGVTFAIGQPS